MLAGQLRLNNLIAIIDDNRLQNDGLSKYIIALEEKSKAFSALGWDTVQVDGHDISALTQVLKNALKTPKPTMIIAETIKGKGSTLTEWNPSFHHAILSPTQYDAIKGDLEKCLR